MAAIVCATTWFRIPEEIQTVGSSDPTSTYTHVPDLSLLAGVTSGVASHPRAKLGGVLAPLAALTARRAFQARRAGDVRCGQRRPSVI
jgi:hypothetical protein